MFGVNKGAVNNATLQISELGVFIPTLLSASMVKKAYSENFNLPAYFGKSKVTKIPFFISKEIQSRRGYRIILSQQVLFSDSV